METLERDEITTWFQPQYDGRSGELAGFEALARWRHPAISWIAPSVFIPLAEEAGLIAEVGARVLRDTVRFADAHAARRGPVDLSINVTRTDLLDPAFPDRVATLLRARRDHTWGLTLEVTELELEEEDGALRTALTAFRQQGVGIAIDHFGSGSSSLRMLQDLPVTAVKIDESFFRRSGALGERMIGAIVGLGLGLGLEVMAEGIETAPQLEVLRRLGCGRMQGYLLAPPAPAGTAEHAAPDIAAAERATRHARSSA
jgi:EAL domain-containing protein (putative c-di-GMP-specific phosphodiesterase class I)